MPLPAACSRQRRQFFRTRAEEGTVADQDRTNALLRQSCEGCFEIAIGSGIHNNELQAQRARRRLQVWDELGKRRGRFREDAEPGQVYLLPVKFAKLKPESPGSQSKTFVSPVRTGQVGIPVDLQRFRLATGEPIYVDFKAVPYAPAEVMEWARRVQNCERWYKQRDWDTSGVIDGVIAVGITHVIAAADKDVTSRRLELVYADESYRVYRVKK